MRSGASHRWRWLKALAGAAVLALVVQRVGVAPFAAGVRALGPLPIVAALAITAFTTTCCAWRWQRVVRSLGGRLPFGVALGAYYRSQFLDATLPGGVLGDVHRGIRHGLRMGDTGLALQAVLWERLLGQAVQIALALAAAGLVPAAWRGSLVAWVLAGGAAAVLAWFVIRRHAGRAPRWLGVATRIPAPVWRQGALASLGAIGGYVALFIVAALAVGVRVPMAGLLPLAVLVLAAAAVPLNVAGFGPREGAAGWLFALAGLGAAHGVAVATAYGVLGLLATLPGGVLLIGDVLRARR